jgi:hypothetical protein
VGIEVGGIGGLIILILDVYAIVKVIGSNASTGAKVGWTVLILLLPLLGVIIWFLFGPKGS